MSPNPHPPRPRPAKRRRVYHESKHQQPVPTVGASAVTDEERAFFLEWATKRHIEKQFVVLALTYWMRVRSKIWTCFLIRPKQLYMIACIHIALKWLGYDEILKCNFIKDLREVEPLTKEAHQEIEFLILGELGWDL
ncbi:unnamed protein product [Ectocarpus sp. 12 AP-2014]